MGSIVCVRIHEDNPPIKRSCAKIGDVPINKLIPAEYLSASVDNRASSFVPEHMKVYLENSKENTGNEVVVIMVCWDNRLFMNMGSCPE